MERKMLAASGMPIYSYINNAANSFFISLYLRAGSMYESEKENGITHFFEHIAIRNINTIMDGELYLLLDKYGLEFNASTSSELVQFYISGAKEHFRHGADIISKIFSPIVLTRAEVNTERQRISAEIREVGDKTTLSAFAQAKVWEGTSLSRSITGTMGTISHIGSRALEDFRRRAMSAENVFMYVTGNVGGEDMEYLASCFENLKFGEGEIHDNFAPIPDNFGKRDGTVHIKSADFTAVRFTFDIDMDRVSVPETDILYDVLLGGYNSDFFIELSERRGLFYDLGGTLERYKNIGTFAFSYELRESKLYEALEMTALILRKFKEELIPEEKFITAGYTDNAMMLFDDARELNFTFAYDNHIMGLGYESLPARRHAYSLITPEKIRSAAKSIFRPENLTLALKGNKKKIDTEIIKKIINIL